MRNCWRCIQGIPDKLVIVIASSGIYQCSILTCGRGQDTPGQPRSLQSCPRSPMRRSPASVPVTWFDQGQGPFCFKFFLPCPKIPTGECPPHWANWTSVWRTHQLPRRARRGLAMKLKQKTSSFSSENDVCTSWLKICYCLFVAGMNNCAYISWWVGVLLPGPVAPVKLSHLNLWFFFVELLCKS